MPITTILFDIGGVLVRTMHRAPRAALAARLSITAEALEELVFGGESGRQAQRGEISAEQQWDFVCRQVAWPVENWRALQKEFFAGDLLDEALVNAIRLLHPRYKTGIISNAFQDVRAAIAEQWHFEDAFDEITISSEVGVMKPDARIFYAALQALNSAPGEAIFVDDFPHNVEGARAVGMHAIHFQSTGQTLQDLEQMLKETS